MKISFRCPFIIFQKCDCLMQNQIPTFDVKEKEDGIEITAKIKCSLCGKENTLSYDITEDTRDLSNDINAFKIVPSIKDEVALVKLDNFKVKTKDKNDLRFFSNYANLRFFDNVVEDVIIPFYYKIHE